LPSDFSLVFHDSLSDSYELSSVLLATADFDGTLQLLTSGWERLLGYGRQELKGKTLLDLLWSDRRSAAAAVAAILERVAMRPVELRVRCRDGQGKRLRLHRRYDKNEQMIYIVAEEAPGRPACRGHAERRAAVRLAA
jgi:PAS domain S-box-containing protein